MIRFSLAVLVGLALCCGSVRLHAAEAGDEDKEAADEEAAQKKREAELDKPISSYIVGLLTLKDKDQRGDGKGVIGTLQSKDKEYQLKALYPESIPELEKLNGKRVKLRGNPRNKGKYFQVISGALATAADK